MTRSFALFAVLALVSTSLFAQSQGDWIVRAGIGYIDPDTSSENLMFEGIELDGYQVDVDSSVRPIVNLTRMMTDNIGVELLASWPFSHDVEGDRELSALGKLGNTKHLPPTLSVQYHFRPNQTFRPYAGVGVNYTYFYDETTTDALHEGIIGTANAALGTNYNGGTTDMNIKNSTGLALQIGADFQFDRGWFVNADLRWIDIEADARLTTVTEDGNGFETILNSRVTADIDPWVFSTAIGFHF